MCFIPLIPKTFPHQPFLSLSLMKLTSKQTEKAPIPLFHRGKPTNGYKVPRLLPLTRNKQLLTEKNIN